MIHPLILKLTGVINYDLGRKHLLLKQNPINGDFNKKIKMLRYQGDNQKKERSESSLKVNKSLYPRSSPRPLLSTLEISDNLRKFQRTILDITKCPKLKKFLTFTRVTWWQMNYSGYRESQPAAKKKYEFVNPDDFQLLNYYYCQQIE